MISLFVLDNDVPCRAERRAHDAGRAASRETGGQRETARPLLGHGEERTPNMPPMSVTLEVSRLSGWLNADANCRESKEGHAMRGEAYGSGGSRRRTTTAHAACRGRRDCRLVVGHGGERTRNMLDMVVTLEVSKLSGWLNADAPWNMELMLVTLDVSKLSSWSNATAP